ncbi:hypothetical protein NC653_016066 [Populus alba x Populus x berolinensis]|uniref:Uncharacterized protein n=1 Tax=Populus alba x Populus x berolinensis TaxID=444605 RepID=A0AAD6QLW7_9ROSI|nr:hypothetical protein NC653_016066 [Populus alba x Populus x berolinensis]
MESSSSSLQFHYHTINKHKYSLSSLNNLPPDNTGLSLIGESLEFLTTGQKGQPEKFILDRMAKFSSKVFKTSLFCEPTAVFCAAGIISIPIDLPWTPFNRGVKASNVVHKELLKIIKQRKIDLAENKAPPTQDILSHMLTTADDDGQCMKP